MSGEDIEEIKRRLGSIQDDVNDMQGDVRVLSTLNKELNRDELINLIQASFGRSETKKATWYYADGSRTLQEIADAGDIAPGSVRRAVRELNKSGWLVQHDQNGNAIYAKAEVTTNLGIEQIFEDELDL